MTIEELSKNVAAFDVESELDKIIQKNDKVFIDANKEMLYSGIDSSGQSLGDYAPRTIEYKKKKGQPYDSITLKDEGDYYKGKSIINLNNEWSIKSSDWKQEKLENDFGMGINGLDQKRTSEIIDDILTPQLTKAFQDIL